MFLHLRKLLDHMPLRGIKNSYLRSLQTSWKTRPRNPPAGAPEMSLKPAINNVLSDVVCESRRCKRLHRRHQPGRRLPRPSYHLRGRR
jgi:hypothetical protein